MFDIQTGNSSGHVDDVVAISGPQFKMWINGEIIVF